MTTEKCKHGNVICSRCVIITDAAKRMSDAINARLTFMSLDELRNGWMAFALADGSSDGTVYPSKNEAIRHQSNEFLYAYFCFRNVLGGANPKDCQIYLNMNRHAYDQGMRLQDPDSPDLIVSTSLYDRITRNKKRNLRPHGN